MHVVVIALCVTRAASGTLCHHSSPTLLLARARRVASD